MSAQAVYTNFWNCAPRLLKNILGQLFRKMKMWGNISDFIGSSGRLQSLYSVSSFLIYEIVTRGMFLGFLLYFLVFLFSLAGFMLNSLITGCF